MRENERNRRIADKRQRILQAGEQVFRDSGFAMATAEQIAETAGMSVGAIYQAMKCKEYIYLSVAEAIGAAILAEVDRYRLMVNGAPDQALEKLLHFRCGNYRTHRLFFDLFSNTDYENIGKDGTAMPALKNRLDEMYRQYGETVAELFRHGADSGIFIEGDPYHAFFYLESLIDSWWRMQHQLTRWEKGKTWSGDETARRIVKLFLREERKKTMAATRNEREIFITGFDFQRLRELVEVAKNFDPEEHNPYLAILAAALQRAIIVTSESIPPDVATMNSRILLSEPINSTRFIASLVFPADKDHNRENVSVLSPLGAVLLGCSEGQTVAAADRNLVIEKILYQPEAAGDYHL